MNTFKIRFKELVGYDGKKLTEIAKLIKLSKEKLYHWHTGYTEPCLDDLIILADYFKVSVDYLIGYENDGGTKIKIPER